MKFINTVVSNHFKRSGLTFFRKEFNEFSPVMHSLIFDFLPSSDQSTNYGLSLPFSPGLGNQCCQVMASCAGKSVRRLNQRFLALVLEANA